MGDQDLSRLSFEDNFEPSFLLYRRLQTDLAIQSSLFYRFRHSIKLLQIFASTNQKNYQYLQFYSRKMRSVLILLSGLSAVLNLKIKCLKPSSWAQSYSLLVLDENTAIQILISKLN